MIVAVLVAADQRLHGQSSTLAVLTQHNDNARTGANLLETRLNVYSVRPGRFGMLFSLPVDGYVYAQPLYVPNVPTTSGMRNVVYVATEHNSVYAFDADEAGPPLWQITFGPPAPQDPEHDPSHATIPDCRDLTPEIGITSTPVIDPDRGLMYVSAKMLDGGGAIRQRMQVLDIATGVVRRQVDITGTITTSSGTITFDPVHQLNRPGLLLNQGVLYAAFGSHCDQGPYHGWILGYDAVTLDPVSGYLVTPTGGGGSIWQSGQGLTADSTGALYAITGNGTFGPSTLDFGDSFLKLVPSGSTLAVADWFTPYNVDSLNRNDNDLGSAGALLIPGTRFVLGGGKEGRLYLVDTDRMGHFDPAIDNVVQSIQVTGVPFERHLHGSPIYWMSPDGGRIYVWPESEPMKVYGFDGSNLTAAPLAQTTVTAPPNAMPGGFLSLSANGAAPRTGIIWAALAPDADASHQTVPGVLRAFDAEDITHELWNSDLDIGDKLGAFAKFSSPTIANGKVYVATFSGAVRVYGLRSDEGGVLPAPWQHDDIGDGGIAGGASYSTATGIFSVTGGGDDVWDSADSFHYVYQPLNGDGQIVARVTSIQNTSAFAKAGVMIRESLAANAAHVMLDVRPTGDNEFMTRPGTGAATTYVGGARQAAPAWLRLVRSGTTVTGSVSADGLSWTTVDSAPLSLAENVYIGLIVCSRNPTVVNTSTFDQVTVMRSRRAHP